MSRRLLIDHSIKDLTQLEPDQFENLTFDLMRLLGLRNCVWRTPGRDGGRDIQGEFFGDDFSGYVRRESWYIECKRYTSSVDWPTVWEKIAYADSNNADVLLFVTSSTLSPQAVDEVNRWNGDRKRPAVRFWNGPDLISRLRLFPQLLIKYELSINPIVDAAVSILPLVKILTKYSNISASSFVFGGEVEKTDAVINSLSELLSSIISEIEDFGRVSIHPFQAAKDGYEWLAGAGVLEAERLDRYVVRALLAIIRCHSSAVKIEVINDRDALLILCDIPSGASFIADLSAISFWGEMSIELIEAKKGLRVRYGRH